MCHSRANHSQDLVEALGKWSPIPCTYAGGAKELADLDLVRCTSILLSSNRSHRLGEATERWTCRSHIRKVWDLLWLPLTLFDSALDIFGGSGVKYADAVAWNNSEAATEAATS